MVLKCPKCGKSLPDDVLYCAYCGHGIKQSARTSQVSAGSILLIVAAAGSVVIFAQSVRALAMMYNWYPPDVAEAWAPYDQLVGVLTFVGLVFGFSAGALSLTRRSFRWTVVCAVLCTLSCGFTWIVSTVAPGANPVFSFFYFFLPLFTPALVGTLLVFPRKAEFER